MKNFISSSIILLAIVCMSNSSCNKKSLENIRTAAYSEAFKLSLEEQVILAKNSKEIIINLTAINDSRCPDGLACIWAGNAIAELSLMSEDGTKASASLCLGDCKDKSNSATVNLSGKTYEVILTTITTDRSGGGAKSEANIIVKKL